MVRLIQQGKLGLAPVHNPKDVVDVCTGTGIWATEYGEWRPFSPFCLALPSGFEIIQSLCLALVSFPYIVPSFFFWRAPALTM